MALRDEVAGAAVRHGPKCRLEDEIARHPKLAQEIRDIIRDRSLSGNAAARVFREHGITIAEHAIKRHRSNSCMTCLDLGVKW